jgi:NAD(P)-dependent dehydrogenase (short-subunit alcohol dehydrogenase family)
VENDVVAVKKVAVVTGAGSGIGRASALALQADGYDVVLAGRRAEELEKTAAMAVAGGGRMLAVATDVSDPAQVVALFARTKEAFGRLDVLFNNAGMGLPAGPMEDIPIEKFKQVVDLNLTACFQCAQEAIKIMKAQSPKGGRIINNGSISAHDIACSQIDVGNADTAMGGRMKAGVPQANGQIAPEAVMDVAHVASAVRYMASLPLDANVQFMTIMATKMPFVGRG